MKFKNYFKLFSALAAISMLNSSCKKSSTDSTSATTSSSLSQFASSLAEDMVLASPTAQRAGTSSSSFKEKTFNDGGVVVFAAPAADDSAEEKKDSLKTLLASTAPTTCAVSLQLVSAGRANCYGPSVNYTSHEFDNSSGSWPGGDLGIWEPSESSTGEACAANHLSSQMKGVISMVDMAQFIGAGMSCVANKAGLTFPATAGSSLDLTSQMASVVTLNSTAMTVSSASIARSTDDSSGNPVYITTLVGTAGTKTVAIRIKHVSTSSDDSTNKGKISVKVVDGSNTDAASLQYEKASSTSGTLLLKSAQFSGASTDPYVSTSNYTVDFSKSWSGNANYFLASVNPSNYTGTFSYAWQAGNGDSHARVFNAIIAESGSITTGSTFFGFGPTMQSGPGSITGMICAWTGPDQTHTPVSKVQRQNIELSSGKFIISGTSYTVFDPVADCDASGAMSMSWSSGASTRTVNSTTENLRAVSEVSAALTLPTAPSNVD